MTPLEIDVRPGPEETRVVLAGEVDLSNVDGLRRALAAETANPLVVDLSAVGYIDSAGIAALFGRASTGGMEIICPQSSNARALIEVTRLTQVVLVRES